MTQHICQSVTVQACPNCGRQDIRPFLSCQHKGQALVYASCRFCGLVFQNPTSTSAEWADFYANHYRRIYNEQEQPTSEEALRQQQRAEVYRGFLEGQALQSVSSHLDVGCSMGVFLQSLKKHWQIGCSVGVEPGKAFRQHCVSQGLRCYDSIESLPVGERFELISLCHVLEHTTNPVEFLRNLVQTRLAGGGRIFIEVPNVRGGVPMEIAHPFCFSQKTLNDTLALAGLEAISVHLHGRPKTDSPYDQRYIAVIARASGAVKSAADIEAVSLGYHLSAKLAMWRGLAHEPWWLFALKYPIRVLKHGFFPTIES